MGESAYAEKHARDTQERYSLLNALFGNEVAQSIFARKNVTGGTVTAQDEYTLAVTLNVNENGKV